MNHLKLPMKVHNSNNLFDMFIETEERECLLLDEYAGCPTEDLEPTSSNNVRIPMAVEEDIDCPSDIDASEPDISSGDDSTDIDAVVKEYKDTIQVNSLVYTNLFFRMSCLKIIAYL